MKVLIISFSVLVISIFFRATTQSLPTTFLFCHGIWGNKNNVKWYAGQDKSNWSIITSSYYTFNFPEVGEKKGGIIKSKITLGQDEDIRVLLEAYKQILKNPFNNQEGIVILGVSRGAMAALNAAGTMQLPLLKALVAEGPADTFLSVVDYYLSAYYVNFGFIDSAVEYVLSKLYFTGYDPSGITPLQTVATIPQDLPILLVHSKDDDVVPIKCARLLYYTLRASGHKHAYLLELDHGKHGKYNLGPSARVYQITAHAFYKRYLIPYDETLALEGEHYLNHSQPALEDIAPLIGIHNVSEESMKGEL